ncbi:FecR family protein [Gaoshiqia sediminis]|uniref:FecR domain-containing protein n=1 Tax=Gaoshiqia sediminis TaxID=2986998 RepID=A0AA41Y8J2_9BACT|nr:FecR domain-containing protein [Gaoshiqia sediminis]MCW0481268.1 FecR domain-containing protein [Gaoshiqia sediminis]
MKQQQLDIDQHVSGFKVPADVSREEAWGRLQQKLNRTPKPNTSKIKKLIWSTAAAAALLLAFLIAFESGFFAPQVQNTQLAQQQVWLPDSSLVRLKARSKLSYKYRTISGNRALRLRGEAFFDVRKGRTFTVRFPGGQLKVLGTKFNIQAYNSESGRVDCFEGSVKVEIHQSEFILEKGQSLTFDAHNTDGPFSFNADEISVLPDNTYHWTSRPLKEVLMLISQREGYQLLAPETLLQQRFTGSLPLTDCHQTLRIISRAMNIDYKIENHQLIIFEKQ